MASHLSRWGHHWGPSETSRPDAPTIVAKPRFLRLKSGTSLGYTLVLQREQAADDVSRVPMALSCPRVISLFPCHSLRCRRAPNEIPNHTLSFIVAGEPPAAPERSYTLLPVLFLFHLNPRVSPFLPLDARRVRFGFLTTLPPSTTWASGTAPAAGGSGPLRTSGRISTW